MTRVLKRAISRLIRAWYKIGFLFGTSKKSRVGAIHALQQNYFLSKEEYNFCVALASRVQKLYDGAISYAKHHSLDLKLVLPGNEWADIVQITGIKFRTSYEDINYLRLTAPFAGYHLPILDRVDVPKFPAAWTGEFLNRLATSGIPTDIAEQTEKLYSVEARLRPIVNEYRNHIRNVPSRYIVRTPRLFGEVGIEVNGILANPDIILCQSRINGMLCSGVMDKLDNDIKHRGRARVIEIGPGHGGLAHALKNIFGDQLEYICVDLPTSLYHSTIYLSTLAAGDGCHVLLPGESVPEHFNYLFVANYMIEEVVASLGPVDLALNAMSFPEMSADQVRYYGLLFKRLLRNDGIVFEENGIVKRHHTDIKAIFTEIFPYRKHISSEIVTTKNWCQDVWSSRYIGAI